MSVVQVRGKAITSGEEAIGGTKVSSRDLTKLYVPFLVIFRGLQSMITTQPSIDHRIAVGTWMNKCPRRKIPALFGWSIGLTMEGMDGASMIRWLHLI